MTCVILCYTVLMYHNYNYTPSGVALLCNLYLICIMSYYYTYYLSLTCLIPQMLQACSVFHTKLSLPPSLPPSYRQYQLYCALIGYFVCSIRGNNFCQNIYNREVSRNRIGFQPGFPFILMIARLKELTVILNQTCHTS